MRYTLGDVILSLPKEKYKAESLWSRVLLRPLSFPAAWLGLAFGLSPNGMSWLSAFIAVAGGVLLGWFDGLWQWAGIFLFFVFSVLDCADGNMARTIKQPNPWGSWTDAVGGYIAYTASLLSLGLAAERMAGLSGRAAGLYVFLGGFSAAVNMLMRAAVQFHKRAASDQGATPPAGREPPEEHEPAAGPGAEKWISENLGVTGIMAPAIALGLCLRRLHWVLFFYTLLYGLGSLAVIFKLALKTRKKP
jgi:phosphatidylglycerophosphate synthase